MFAEERHRCVYSRADGRTQSSLLDFTQGEQKLQLPEDDFFFFFFFFTQVQTPVTLCSGELWSILVVRPAHSADLRSRLRHVSSAPSVAYSTGCSRVVTHPGTNPARRCLTSVI